MNHSLPVESNLEINFDSVPEGADETSRSSYIGYSERSFTNLFNFNVITADKDSSNPDNESDSESNESEKEEVASKKRN